MKADKITLELFSNRGGVYIYATNLAGKKLIGCVAKPRIVDGLLKYVMRVVEEAE